MPWAWPAGEARASASPQNPRKPATRWLALTEIPRTKRHTPVHLLCVLKARKQPVSSVNARELGC